MSCADGRLCVDAIVLASGFSRRFGHNNKLLYPFCGQPLASHTLKLLCGMSVFGRVLFVWASDEVKQLAAQYPVELIHNPNAHFDVGNSAKLGVQHSNAEHYMFFSCDQPLLTKELIHTMLHAQKPGHITVPCYGGQQSHPAVFSADFRQDFLALPHGVAPRIIKKHHAEKVQCIEVSSPYTLADVDTQEQLEALQSYYQNKI